MFSPPLPHDSGPRGSGFSSGPPSTRSEGYTKGNLGPPTSFGGHAPVPRGYPPAPPPNAFVANKVGMVQDERTLSLYLLNLHQEGERECRIG